MIRARAQHRGHAGVTILEVMVATAILAMIGTMIYAAFDHTSQRHAPLGTAGT